MVDRGRDENHTEVIFLVQQGFYPIALTKTKCDSGKTAQASVEYGSKSNNYILGF